MRKIHLLTAAMSATVLAIACGGSSDSPPASGGGADAGLDASFPNNGSDGSVAIIDSSAGQADDASTCVIDADLNTVAPVDAALDDAGDSVGTCLACVKTSCASDLATCNADCTCNTSFACFANCIGGVGNTLLTCAGQCFPGGLSSITSNPVVLCTAESCSTQCAVSGLLGGGGGGKKDGGAPPVTDSGAPDAASDASTDAAAD